MKNVLARFRVLAVAIPIALTAGCFGGKGGGGGSSADSPGPGLGESTADPTGTAYVLPAAVSVQSSPFPGYPSEVTPPDVALGYGLVQPVVPLVNSSSGSVTVTFPGGLIFISESDEVQNGILVQERVIVIPPTTTQRIALGLDCANGGRHAPAEEDLYRFGPVTDNPELLELIGLLADKDISQFSTQFAVWEITDFGGLTDETRAEIEALPPAP